MQEEHEMARVGAPSILGGGTIDVEGRTPPFDLPNSTHGEFDQQDSHDQKPGWRALLSFVDPGFLVSLACIDPGNMETDLQAGANHGYQGKGKNNDTLYTYFSYLYELHISVLNFFNLSDHMISFSNHGYKLFWVILIGMIFAPIIQSVAANLGVSTGRHLPELCKVEYPPLVKYCLWLLAEGAVIAADILEVIGTAFELNVLFHIPVWAGVLLPGCSTLVLLGLQRYGIRKLEMLIATFVFVMAACFFSQLGHVKPPASKVLKGMFIPNLSGSNAVRDTISLLSALVMPHNLFLHSALVLSMKVPRSVRAVNGNLILSDVYPAEKHVRQAALNGNGSLPSALHQKED